MIECPGMVIKCPGMVIKCPGMVIKCPGSGVKGKTEKRCRKRNLLGSKTCYQCGRSLEGETEKRCNERKTLLEAKTAINADAVWNGKPKNVAVNGILTEAKPAAIVDTV